MGVNEFAAKAVRTIGRRTSKKLRRKGIVAAELPRPEPTVIKGESYVCGYAMREVMPDDIKAKTYWIAGHGMGHPIESVHDPITVSAMWVGADDNGGYVHISADIILQTLSLTLSVTSLRTLLSKASVRVFLHPVPILMQASIPLAIGVSL